MVIYGVATLSVSLLVGLFAGDLLGKAVGVKANVGGVGIAMVILLVLSGRFERYRHPQITAQGVTFWSAMYVPIVVAVAATQNVVAAVTGGAVALLAGTLAVAGGFALIPVLARFGPNARGRRGGSSQATRGGTTSADTRSGRASLDSARDRSAPPADGKDRP